MLNNEVTKICVYRGTDNSGSVYSYLTAVTDAGEFLVIVDGGDIILTGPLCNAAEGELVAEFDNFAEAEASGAIPAPPNGGSRAHSAHKPRRRRNVA